MNTRRIVFVPFNIKESQKSTTASCRFLASPICHKLCDSLSHVFVIVFVWHAYTNWKDNICLFVLINWLLLVVGRRIVLESCGERMSSTLYCIQQHGENCFQIRGNALSRQRWEHIMGEIKNKYCNCKTSRESQSTLKILRIVSVVKPSQSYCC